MPTDFSDGGRSNAVDASTRPTMMPPAKAPNTLPKPAKRHRHIGDQRERRADVGIDVENIAMMAPAKPTSAARDPSPARTPVLVDADQRHGAGILTRRLKGAAEISTVDEEVQRAEGGDRDQRAEQLRHGQEDSPDRDGLAAQPGMRDAAVIRCEEELRQARMTMASPNVEKICTMPALALARTAKRTINR